MKTIEQRVLRGPNLWSRRPCLQILADLGDLAGAVSSDLPGFDDDLLSLLPGMRDFEEPLEHGSLIAEVIGRVAFELQRLTDAEPDVRFTTFVQGRQAQVTIISAYRFEQAALLAMDAAMSIVGALCDGENVRIEQHLAAIRVSVQPDRSRLVDLYTKPRHHCAMSRALLAGRCLAVIPSLDAPGLNLSTGARGARAASDPAR